MVLYWNFLWRFFRCYSVFLSARCPLAKHSGNLLNSSIILLSTTSQDMSRLKYQSISLWLARAHVKRPHCCSVFWKPQTITRDIVMNIRCLSDAETWNGYIRAQLTRTLNKQLRGTCSSLCSVCPIDGVLIDWEYCKTLNRTKMCIPWPLCKFPLPQLLESCLCFWRNLSSALELGCKQTVGTFKSQCFRTLFPVALECASVATGWKLQKNNID